MGKLKGTVHLVGRDVVEELALPLPVPSVLGGLEHGQGAQDIGPREGQGVLDRAVHVALGGQMNHAVDVIFLKDSAHRLEIADVGPHEHVVRGLLDILQISQVAGVGQLIQVYDSVLGVLVHEEAHDVTPDEASAAGYENITFIVHSIIILFKFLNTLLERIFPIRNCDSESILHFCLVKHRVMRPPDL